MTPVGGLVLAGGASRRMGADKALMVIEGDRLVDRAVATVGEVADHVVVACGPRLIGGLGVDQVADEVADAGPLAGIVAGLDHLAARGCTIAAVLAVDHPWPSAGVLAAAVHALGSLDAAEEHATGRVVAPAGALAPEVDGQLQPLHAAWRVSVAGRLRHRLADGHHAVRDGFAAVGGVAWDGWRRHDPDARFAHNVNRPDDLPQSRDWC